MENLAWAIFSHCTVSLSQVTHGSKNTVYIIGFLEFLQFLHSGLSGIKAGLSSPRLQADVSLWIRYHLGSIQGLQDLFDLDLKPI